MFTKKKLCWAVLSTIAAGNLSAESYALEEIVVTATKKSASMQDVPIAVQAMTGETLEEQNVTSFEDYVKHLPSVNFGGRGPGQNEIYIRGAAVDAINIAVAESQGSAPNVALYLDEQPVSAGGRNLDVYVTDMERIEVLPGPQGTLFGASSQAGTVRLITNKPVLDEFQAGFNTGYSMTKSGKSSNKVEAMVNIPLIEDKLAVRGAFYTDNKGGYIDNVGRSITVPDPSVNASYPGDTVLFDQGTVFANGDTVTELAGRNVQVRRQTADNIALVEDNFNDTSYQGMRLGLKYMINDDWSALVQVSQQTLNTDGVFDYDADMGDLKVARFSEDSLEDEFTQYALTLEGRLGALDLIYTGAYLDRELESKMDYTAYNNSGAFVNTYQCEYLVGSFYHGLNNGFTTAYTFDPTISGDPNVIECGSPVNNVGLFTENTNLTHEVRVSTDPDKRLRFLGGVYYEDNEIKSVVTYPYSGFLEADYAPLDISTNPSIANAEANVRGPSNIAAINDIFRRQEQIAVFGELSFDITDALTVAGSARYYDLEYDLTGYGAWVYGNRSLFTDDADPSNDIRPNLTGGRDYGIVFGEAAPLSIDDVITKLTVTWTPTDDLLFYVTSSEGYRPPGLNRAATKEGGAYDRSANNVTDTGQQCGAAAAIDSNLATGFPGYCLPYVFESDTLDNLEFGWKATLLNGNLRFNGNLYQIDWEGIQVSQFDSQNISNLNLVDNGGDAEINGVEIDLVWAVSENLTLFAAGSYNDTELTRVDPAFAPIIQDEGNPLPLAPEFQTNLRARYSWDLAQDMEAYWQVGGKYADKTLNSIVDTPEEPNTFQDSYTLFDGSIGVRSDDGWGAELYVNNISDERAQLHINRQDFSERITTNRPRTVGLRLSYDFN